MAQAAEGGGGEEEGEFRGEQAHQDSSQASTMVPERRVIVSRARGSSHAGFDDEPSPGSIAGVRAQPH